METDNATTVELVSYIEQWSTDTQSLVVRSVRLGINTTCPVIIVDFNSPECPEDPPRVYLSGDIRSIIIGGAIAGVLVLVVFVAAVIVILLLVVRHRKTGSKNVQTKDTKLVFLLCHTSFHCIVHVMQTQITCSVEPSNKGHVGTIIINSAVFSFVERLSSFGGSKCIKTIGKAVFGTSTCVLCREVY